MKTYVEFEILEGAYDISCPDALCPLQGIMNIEQDMKALVSSDLIEKHTRFRLNRGTNTDFCFEDFELIKQFPDSLFFF